MKSKKDKLIDRLLKEVLNISPVSLQQDSVDLEHWEVESYTRRTGYKTMCFNTQLEAETYLHKKKNSLEASQYESRSYLRMRQIIDSVKYKNNIVSEWLGRVKISWVRTK